MRHEPSHLVTEFRAGQRFHVDRIVELASHLPPGDRALITSVYERGMCPAEVARTAGKPARTIRRKVQRLVKRISSPEFTFVLHSRHRWPHSTRKIAEAIILRGEPQRHAAARLNVTLHRVRRELERIRAVAELN